MLVDMSMAGKKTLLTESLKIACFSIAFSALAYYINLLVPTTFLPRQSLLFAEGLLLIVFGLLFLIAGESQDPHKRDGGARGAGVSKQQLTVGGGAPSYAMRNKLTSRTIQIILILISTGLILTVLSLL